MKPDCDETIRGEFRPIDSNVPGMPVSEHLPLVARQMDKVCVVRSVHHRMLCHNPAIYAALSGREVGESLAVSVKTAATRDDYPHVGSLVARFGPECRDVPPFVAYPFQLRNGPTPIPGQHAGLLGRAYDPFVVVKDPNAPDFQVEELEFPMDVAEARLDDRRMFSEVRRRAEMARRDRGRRGAGRLLPAGVRITHRPARQRGLRPVSRRFLATRPVRPKPRGAIDAPGPQARRGGGAVRHRLFPTAAIDGPSWDTHLDNFPRLKNELLPPADAALAALLEDMQARGLLQETLVIWAGEFGRTPQVGARRSNNSSNFSGRDHWPQCYTILMAGGGIPGGTYFGASDRLGWYPKENPIAVGDLAATILDAFGIDPRQTYRDTLGRPHFLAEGEPVTALWG